MGITDLGADLDNPTLTPQGTKCADGKVQDAYIIWYCKLDKKQEKRPAICYSNLRFSQSSDRWYITS